MPREGGARKRANRHDTPPGGRVVGRGQRSRGWDRVWLVGMKETIWFSLQPDHSVTLCLPLPLLALEVAS